MVVVQQHTTWQHFQARFAEWYSGAILFAWGCYVVLEPGLFTDPRAAALWKGMAAMLSQQTWGLGAVVVGAARLGALYVNGHHHRTPTVRLVASFFSAFVWTQVLVGLAHSNVPNTGLVVYTALVCADIYSAFRASADVTFVAKSRDINGPESQRGGFVEERP